MTASLNEEKTTTRKIELVDPVTDAQTRALAIANTFREKIGEPQITGIIPGETGSSSNCILARTFNASCSVGYNTVTEGYDDDGNDILAVEYGWAGFYDKDMAEKFRDSINEHLEGNEPKSELRDEPLGGGRNYAVSLPTAIAQIAVDFDADDLDEQFNEKQYDRLPVDIPGIPKRKSIKEVLGLA